MRQKRLRFKNMVPNVLSKELKRPRQGSSDEELLSTPRAEAAAPSSPRPSYDRHMSLVRRVSLHTAQKHPFITILSRFGRIWGSFWDLRNETARRVARPFFGCISFF